MHPAKVSTKMFFHFKPDRIFFHSFLNCLLFFSWNVVDGHCNISRGGFSTVNFPWFESMGGLSFLNFPRFSRNFLSRGRFRYDKSAEVSACKLHMPDTCAFVTHSIKKFLLNHWYWQNPPRIDTKHENLFPHHCPQIRKPVPFKSFQYRRTDILFTPKG